MALRLCIIALCLALASARARREIMTKPAIPTCVVDGQEFMDGETIRKNACGDCICAYGREMCPLAGCPPPSCVDAVFDPEACCPYSCPNGENCYAGEQIIEAGKYHQEDIDEYCFKVCTCPGFGRPAECQTACQAIEPMPIMPVINK